MSNIESQLKVAKKMEDILKRMELQVSSVEQHLQTSQTFASELADKIKSLDTHRPQLEDTQKKLKELNDGQQAFIAAGSKYVTELTKRCSELEKLKNGIGWRISLVDNAVRFIAIMVIVFFLVVSLGLLWSSYPDWATANSIISGPSAGESIGAKPSLPHTYASSSAKPAEVLLCAVQEGEAASPSPRVDERIPESLAPGDSLKEDGEESTTAGNKSSVSPEPTEQARVGEDANSASQPTNLEAAQHPGLSNEVPDIKGSAIRAKDRQIIAGSDSTAIEIPDAVVEPRIRPQDETSDLEKSSPVSIADVSQEKSMSIHEARLWSFATLAFSVVAVFGSVVFALVKIVGEK